MSLVPYGRNDGECVSAGRLISHRARLALAEFCVAGSAKASVEKLRPAFKAGNPAANDANQALADGLGVPNGSVRSGDFISIRIVGAHATFISLSDGKSPDKLVIVRFQLRRHRNGASAPSSRLPPTIASMSLLVWRSPRG